MEESMKFNLQVCTIKEQSERLLKLGLNPETADCRICTLITNPNQYLIMDMGMHPLDTDETPAWSLHRLLCMLDYDNAATFNIMPNLAYEDVIATISLRIDCGAFNKQYLKQ